MEIPALKDGASFRRCAYCKSKLTCMAKAKCLLKKEAREFSSHVKGNTTFLQKMRHLNEMLEFGDDDIIARREPGGKWLQDKEGKWSQEHKGGVVRRKVVPFKKSQKPAPIKDLKDLPGGSPPTAQEKAAHIKQQAAGKRAMEEGTLRSKQTIDEQRSSTSAEKINPRHPRVTGKRTGKQSGARKGMPDRPHGTEKIQVPELNPRQKVSELSKSAQHEITKRVRSRLSNKGIKRSHDHVHQIVKGMRIKTVKGLVGAGVRLLTKYFK